MGMDTPVIYLVDVLLGRLRFLQRRPEMFLRYQRFLAMVGVYATLAAGAIFSVNMMILAIKANKMDLLFQGLAGVLVAVVLHYIAAKHANAGHALMQQTAYRVSTSSFMDCMGLIAVLVAIGVVVMGVFLSVRFESAGPLWPALIGGFLTAHLAVFCLNPEQTLNILCMPEGASAGETALGVLTFVCRSVLAMGPIALGFGALIGTVWMLVGTLMTIMHKPGGMENFQNGTNLVCGAALAPFLLYLSYLLYMLGVDLYLAIFQIAKNTDRGGRG